MILPPICCALVFVSPWFGYFSIAHVSLFIFLTRTTAEEFQHIMRASQPEAAADG
jgi:hypothetical protein